MSRFLAKKRGQNEALLREVGRLEMEVASGIENPESIQREKLDPILDLDSVELLHQWTSSRYTLPTSRGDPVALVIKNNFER